MAKGRRRELKERVDRSAHALGSVNSGSRQRRVEGERGEDEDVDKNTSTYLGRWISLVGPFSSFRGWERAQ